MAQVAEPVAAAVVAVALFLFDHFLHNRLVVQARGVVKKVMNP